MEYNANWWKDLPCHLSPGWNLHGTNELDLRKLKIQIEDDMRIAPYFMKAESLLYKAFLEVPPTSFLNRGHSKPLKALKFLTEAEEHIKTTLKHDRDAQNGYGIVINAFRMWIYSELIKKRPKMDKVEIVLKELKPLQTHKSQAFVNVTLAATLSRLGLHRYEEASELFSKALEQYPGNTHWMFGKALMLGRLARSARSRIARFDSLPNEIAENFERELELLEEIKSEDPSFAWPIAYLGQCLFNLKRKEEALACLKVAMSTDSRNTDIALISARVHKWIGHFSKSEEILVNLPVESKTPEVLFQLGLIYYERSRKVSRSKKTEVMDEEQEETNQLLKKALEYMEYAVAEDDCHYPAAIKCAEVSARLGDDEEASDKYLNLFQRRDILPVTQFHIRRSANFVKHVLEPTDALDNIYKMLDLCARHFSTYNENGLATFQASVKKDAEKFFQELDAMSKDEDNELRFQATLYLGEVHRMLGNYGKAKQLIVGLMESDQQELNEVELRWILGKCHCALGELDDAKHQADTLELLPSQLAFPADELHADVLLKRAKDVLSAYSSISEDLDNYHYVIDNLREAIRKGSLEACYLYLTKVDGLQERLCSLGEDIPQTLAEIYKCIEGVNTYHKDFPVIFNEGTSNDPVDFIKKRIESVLVHPMARLDADVPDGSRKRYTFLSETRHHLFEFERYNLQVCHSNESWSQFCQKAAETVLSNARKLLDHVIFDYQIKVLKAEPAHTQFPVHFDWKEAKEDREGVKCKFNGYLKARFPNYTMPEEMIKFFVELQPMYSKENLWLPALGSFTVEDKHKGTNNDNDTFNIVLLKAEPIPYKKVDLVRRSCFEVEKIAQFILNFLQHHFN